MQRVAATPGGVRGFTLLELMIVVTILGIIASIGVPQYASALRVARISKAKQELVTIACAVDSFTANNAGRLPLTLHQVGFGGKRDPWGVPYCFFNYGDGTGDGLDWAVEAGLVDPSAIVAEDAGAAAAVGGAPVSRGAFGLLDAVVRPGRAASRWALPASQRPQGVIRVEGVAEPVKQVAARVVSTLARDLAPGEADALTLSLANTAAPSLAIFTGVAPEVVRRRDRYMFPLNTDYDLFSLGPNGRTAVSLGETIGQDDVIRANNGGFFGLAGDY